MQDRNLLEKLSQVLIDLHEIAREFKDPIISKHLRDVAHKVSDIIKQVKQLFHQNMAGLLILAYEGAL